MKRLVLVLSLMTLVAIPAFATFSIVAFDPVTGDVGVAVASRVLAVGAEVPWVEAGVGAVATQASNNVAYGKRGLELLRQGLTAQQVLDRLLAEDNGRNKEGRQVAVIDKNGNVAVHTGTSASDWRGHKTGKYFSVQGNVLAGPEVVEAMARTFENTQGELAEKMYAAMKAGDDAGGDRRGRQSASIIVYRKDGGRLVNDDIYADVRVDDHPQPFGELRRLLNLALFRSNGPTRDRLITEGKIREARVIVSRMLQYRPDAVNAQVMSGVLMHLDGDTDAAVRTLQRARTTDQAAFEAEWNRILSAPAFAQYKSRLEAPAFVNRVIPPPRDDIGSVSFER